MNFASDQRSSLPTSVLVCVAVRLALLLSGRSQQVL
jgi:hypothetical protein